MIVETDWTETEPELLTMELRLEDSLDDADEETVEVVKLDGTVETTLDAEGTELEATELEEAVVVAATAATALPPTVATPWQLLEAPGAMAGGVCPSPWEKVVTWPSSPV